MALKRVSIVEVEDPPLDHGGFEGVVRKGERGGGYGPAARPKIARRPVPITVDIAHQLAEVARGRPPNAPLLLKPSGEPWRKSDHSRPFERAVDRCGLADWEGKGCPAKITIYALRHGSIVRQIRANAPIRIVAVGHDTSVAMIERHYSAEIAHFADDLARAGLLDTGTRQLRQSGGHPVVPIRAA